MRVIKFRAWDEQWNVMYNNFQFIKSGEDQNDWIVFTAENIPFNSGWKDNPFFRPQIKIMQFTGLTDKNGKEIYEWDIVRCVAKGSGWPALGRVEYIQISCCFGINTGKELIDNDNDFYAHFWTHEDFEVIGNIYENQNLLQ